MVNFIILNKLKIDIQHTTSHQIHFHLTINNNKQTKPKHTSTHLKDHEAVIGKQQKLGSPIHTLTHTQQPHLQNINGIFVCMSYSSYSRQNKPGDL